MLYLGIGVRCLIGLVFLVSSLSKVAGGGAFGGFVGSLRAMRLLPAGLVRPLAALVVAGELAVWGLLAVPVAATAAVGLAVAAGLLLAFTIGIGLALHRGVRSPCRCFGASAVPLGLQQVLRNGVLAAAAAVGVVAWQGNGSVHAGGVMVSVAAGLLLGGLVITLDDLVELFRPVGDQAVSKSSRVR